MQEMSLESPAAPARPHVLSLVELRVDGALGVDIGRLERTFPTVQVRVHSARSTKSGRTRDAIDVCYEDWQSPRFDFWSFDRIVDGRVDRDEPLVLGAPARHASRLAYEVLTRAQRRIHRLNAETRGPWFERVLQVHRALHDLEKPLVRADYDHALDAWQWTLRLDPSASAAAQLAALLHDVERLDREADLRMEQYASDYRAYKEAHARRGATSTFWILRHAGLDEASAYRVASLVAQSETTSSSRDVILINDADALSFFSLNCPGFADYFGLAHTRRKVAYTVARMSTRALEELPRIRLRPDIASLVGETLDAPVREIEAVG